MSMPLKNMIMSLVIFMIGAAYLYLSLQLPERTIQNVPGPSFFPLIISGVILILALALLGKSIVGMRDRAHNYVGAELPLRTLAVLGWFVLYLAVLPYAGFLIASIPFFAGLMFLCQRPKLVYIVIGSILIPVILFYLFREGFTILLPAGQWM